MWKSSESYEATLGLIQSRITKVLIPSVKNEPHDRECVHSCQVTTQRICAFPQHTECKQCLPQFKMLDRARTFSTTTQPWDKYWQSWSTGIHNTEPARLLLPTTVSFHVFHDTRDHHNNIKTSIQSIHNVKVARNGSCKTSIQLNNPFPTDRKVWLYFHHFQSPLCIFWFRWCCSANTYPKQRDVWLGNKKINRSTLCQNNVS